MSVESVKLPNHDANPDVPDVKETIQPGQQNSELDNHDSVENDSSCGAKECLASKQVSAECPGGVQVVPRSLDTATSQPSNNSWLLRLFESKLFDMSIAITYLFNSKESGKF